MEEIQRQRSCRDRGDTETEEIQRQRRYSNRGDKETESMKRQMRYRHCQDRDTERLRRYCSDTAEVKVKRRWRDGRGWRPS